MIPPFVFSIIAQWIREWQWRESEKKIVDNGVVDYE